MARSKLHTSALSGAFHFCVQKTMPLAADIVKSGALRLLGSARRPAPSLFSLPGLEARANWGGADGLARYQPLADAIKRIEHATDALADEYVAAKAARAAAGKAASDYAADASLHGGRWDWLSYVDRGAVKPSFVAEAPVAAWLLRGVPRLMTGVPFGHAFYSALGAGAEIQPHTAPMNLRLRVHVPLSVPAGDVGMRLAGEEVRWKRGEALVFDDSYVHETWNRTAADRVVLLFDVWHPDLGDDEIEAVVEMFRRAAKPK